MLEGVRFRPHRNCPVEIELSLWAWDRQTDRRTDGRVAAVLNASYRGAG